jgi:hypothetical protein
VNDANDVKAALEKIGFSVDLLLNASLSQMEERAVALRNKLSRSNNACGFFFYAGHGVQAQGRNYLIPVDADVKAESFLKTKAFDVQSLLDELNEAKNQLNVVVLDACRDNPFGWSRSGMRGLSVVGGQPAGSILVYATSAGKTAADGTGRNGLFTSQLLKNLTANIEVKEIFNRTGADVLTASNGEQHPAVYNQFFGTVYFQGGAAAPAPLPAAGTQPAAAAPSAVPPSTSAMPQQSGEFSGTWNSIVSYTHNGLSYQDRYAITLFDDGSCGIQIKTQDGQTQSGGGFWSEANGIFKLEADFFDAVIPRLSAIKWTSVYARSPNGRQLKVNIKPAPAFTGVVPITLNKAR